MNMSHFERKEFSFLPCLMNSYGKGIFQQSPSQTRLKALAIVGVFVRLVFEIDFGISRTASRK